MKKKKYFRYLNRHQREVYKNHIWCNDYRSEINWCLDTFGFDPKRWQVKRFYHELDYKTLLLFKHSEDSVFFTLKWR